MIIQRPETDIYNLSQAVPHTHRERQRATKSRHKQPVQVPTNSRQDNYILFVRTSFKSPYRQHSTQFFRWYSPILLFFRSWYRTNSRYYSSRFIFSVYPGYTSFVLYLFRVDPSGAIQPCLLFYSPVLLFSVFVPVIPVLYFRLESWLIPVFCM